MAFSISPLTCFMISKLHKRLLELERILLELNTALAGCPISQHDCGASFVSRLSTAMLEGAHANTL